MESIGISIWKLSSEVVLFSGYLFLLMLIVMSLIKKLDVPFRNHMIIMAIAHTILVAYFVNVLVVANNRIGPLIITFFWINGTTIWLTSLYILRVLLVFYRNDRSLLKHPLKLIEDQKRLFSEKEQFEKLSLELSRQNKQLNDFANIASHNLRSPMASLRALFELYERETKEQDKELMLDNIKLVIENMNNTVNDLTEVVKIRKGYDNEVQLIDVQQLIDAVINSLKPDIERTKAEINVQVLGASQIVFSKVYLESIFLNLLTNSIKYRHVSRPLRVNIEVKSRSSEVQIIVSDNGLGIDLDKYGKDIFNMNKTFHGNKDARGVGLYITRNQIESLGGNIQVKSKINEGTTFIITIPQEKV
jgi:signal transduction histidine kinase